MYYLHHRITKKVYEYYVRNKLVNTVLIAKWKKTVYEQLLYNIRDKFQQLQVRHVVDMPRPPEGPFAGAIARDGPNDGMSGMREQGGTAQEYIQEQVRPEPQGSANCQGE